MLRCQLIIDGVKQQQGTRRPKSIVADLLKDLQVDYVDADIKSAFRLGPINDKASRPHSIKVLFASNHFEDAVFKNIQKGKEQWKGFHISDAFTIEEQECRHDMKCIHAAGKARGVDVKLKGSSIIIPIDPKGLPSNMWYFPRISQNSRKIPLKFRANTQIQSITNAYLLIKTK